MNNDTLKGQWKQVAGAIKKQWGKLTDDDLASAEGNSEQLIGKIQERYGIAKDEAKKQWIKFEAANIRAEENAEAKRQAEKSYR